MNKSIIRFLLFKVMQFAGIFLLLPFIVSLIYKETQGIYYLLTGIAVIVLGTLGSLKKPVSRNFYSKEGYVTVSLAWLILSLVGAIPYSLSGDIPHYVDALFETVSGFTTTGASILTDVEAISMTSMFFRCFTNWIGGMGVLVFMMAVLPLSGSSNMHLMRAESTGADVSKLVPKVRDSALILYGMYFGLTVVLVIIYLCLGTPLYDAFVLSFSTMGTGGFARYNASLGAYSYGVQIVTTIFMFLCGINFNAFFLILKKKAKEFFKMEEVRWYFIIALSISVLVFFQIRGSYGNDAEAFHHATFQVVSIMTTTGFATADFNLWTDFAKALILLVMLLGGCAGATAGGIKISRLIISLKSVDRELNHLTHPRSVKKIRFSGATLSDETVKNVQSFMIAFIAVFTISLIVVFSDNFDFTTSFTSVLSMLGNVGPGLGLVGPTGNFSIYSDASKLVLIFDMLAGRLEIFPILVLFYPGTWRKA